MVFRAQKPVSNFPVSRASFSEEMASFRSLFSPKGKRQDTKGHMTREKPLIFTIFLVLVWDVSLFVFVFAF